MTSEHHKSDATRGKLQVASCKWRQSVPTVLVPRKTLYSDFSLREQAEVCPDL